MTIDKQIYERYIEEFTDTMKDYVKETKLLESSDNVGWIDILEQVESFRTEMLGLLGEIK